MKISIITPSYNQSHLIERTLRSVLTQKGDFDLEYIVMDGGSTDNTVKILEKIEAEHKAGKFNNFQRGLTFSWQSKKDKGQSDAINQGLKKATGDILAYLNSDDTYPPDTLQKVASAFENQPDKLWLTGYCNIIDAEDKPMRNIIASYKNFWLRHYTFKRLLIINFISQPASFWTKKTINRVGYFNQDLHYAMDYDYWLRAGKIGDPIIITSPLANFRIHGSSKGETAFRKQFKEDQSISDNYTSSRLTRFLHRVHNGLIVLSYSIIK